jgi:cytochrome c oxidase subunit III
MSDISTIQGHLERPLVVDSAQSPLTPENMGKLGMWLFLSADATTFGAALAAYLALRIGSTKWPVPSSILGIPSTTVMTLILICSSMTMIEALSAIRRDDQARFRGFLALTILAGLAFLVLQAREWDHLITAQGLSIDTSLFSATFFILTGFHGCHVIAGVVYLGVLLIGGLSGKISAAKYGVVEVAALYWHFLDLVWIAIFTLVYLI